MLFTSYIVVIAYKWFNLIDQIQSSQVWFVPVHMAEFKPHIPRKVM